MKWLAYRRFNRFDLFWAFFIGFMCAAESYWWITLVVPCAVVSAVMEVCIAAKAAQPERDGRGNG